MGSDNLGCPLCKKDIISGQPASLGESTAPRPEEPFPDVEDEEDEEDQQDFFCVACGRDKQGFADCSG